MNPLSPSLQETSITNDSNRTVFRTCTLLCDVLVLYAGGLVENCLKVQLGCWHAWFVFGRLRVRFQAVKLAILSKDVMIKEVLLNKMRFFFYDYGMLA